jgi:hypothetical protein
VALKAKSGRVLTDDDVDRLVAAAEAGFDTSTLKARRGRPFLDASATEHSPRLTVRVPATLRDQVSARAASEGRTVSDVLRALLQAYVEGQVGDVPGQRE